MRDVYVLSASFMVRRLVNAAQSLHDVDMILICLLYYLDTNLYFQVEVIHNCSILAAVGLKMASTPGVSATLFDALAKVIPHFKFCMPTIQEVFSRDQTNLLNDGPRQILM